MESGEGRPVIQFAIKTAIVAVAVVLSITYLISYVDELAQIRIQEFRATTVQELRAATRFGGREFWTKIEHEIERMAAPESDLPPEKKKKILAEIKVISDRWRPFVSELSTVVGSSGDPGKR